MPIQFPTLLQDSWNFIRNQRNFTFIGLGLLMLVQLLLFYFTPKLAIDPTTLTPEMLDKYARESLLASLPVLLISAIGILLHILLVMNIKSINNGQYHHFFQHIGTAFARILPFIGLYILMSLPMSVGSAALVAGAAGGFSIIAFPLMITGIFIFVKWCLAAYVYLVEEPQKRVFETLSFTWQMSRGKMGILFLFCLLSYLFPTVITSLIGNIGGIGRVLSHIVAAFLSLFVTVFGFRFYQAYRQI
ncbi:hypothetical protein E4T80_02325 [Muribacter muris]|uniref:Beta-methylgalactoside transporter n=1 Tax=Muribacter muris TaxID=67855 RepID=A0A4Y9K6A7_9PAST|nr:hypothetical protein [Muribacter muris]MBF0784315.1 hypothetical protein [Muribacter muris]MBF0826948.1 hypothetical protein [Muribacter muris]TFV13052.1 hypothetical protein E4T80_02325 [Muribacter muris]